MSYSSSSLPIILDTSIWDSLTRCVVLQIPDDPVIELKGNHQQEIDYIYQYMESSSSLKSTPSKRCNTYLGGRQALRQSFASLDYDLVEPVLKDEFGAPIVFPSTIKGSISHKHQYVVGLGSLLEKGKVGVDLEMCHNKAYESLQRRLLTPLERQSLGSLQHIGVSIEEELLLRFSMKESVYKSLHPYLLRSIGFQEVEVYPAADGSATIKFMLSPDTSNPQHIYYEASWQRFQQQYWLTAVRIWLTEDHITVKQS